MKKGKPKRVALPGVIGLMVLAFISGYTLRITSEDEPRVAVATPTPTPTPDQYPEFTFDNMLLRMNEARLAANLEQVATDSYLTKYALEDLKNNCPISSHSNFRLWGDLGAFTRYIEVGEVLVSNIDTPQEAMDSFLKSPTHKDTILDPSYTRVGIGIVTSPVNCVSMIFGR